MLIRTVDINELHESKFNPRIKLEKTSKEYQQIAASIQEFGFVEPLVVNEHNMCVIGGHQRLQVLKDSGATEVECVMINETDPEREKAFRLADNKTAELAEWDEDLLGKEMQEIINIDMSQFGFSIGEDELGEEMQDDKYTLKVKIPQYEITGECPEISDMLDSSKADELIQEVEAADIPEEIREFLIQAARRHNVFNYRNIAEYYAHAEPEVQKLFEKSALVIIDVNDAIANGYVQLATDITDIMEGEADEE